MIEININNKITISNCTEDLIIIIISKLKLVIQNQLYLNAKKLGYSTHNIEKYLYLFENQNQIQ